MRRIAGDSPLTGKRNLAILVSGLLVVLALSPSLFAAEKPAPAKPDPILADLKATAQPEWYPQWDRASDKPGPPSLRIIVTLQGTAVAKASASGGLKLDSLIDERGKSYRRACETRPSVGGNVDAVCHNKNGSKSDSLRLDFTLHNRPSMQSIRELRGSLVLETGGESQEIVIKDAFKNLEDRADNENLDPDAWSKPLADKPLEELGLKVVVVRLPLQKQYTPADVKDAVRVNIESSSYAVTGWEVRDAKDKNMEMYCYGCSGGSPHWYIDFQSKAVVPRDGSIRLTIQKNDRRIRVPFVVKDVAIPKVDKNFDVPASPEDVAAEAETLPPGDPVLAGLKLSAKASWRPWQDNSRPPDLVVDVEVAGETEWRTSGYGEFEIESALDESGNPIDFSSDEAKMKVHFCNDDHFTIGAVLAAAPPIKKIRQLQGAMSIQIGEKHEIVTVKEFLKGMKINRPIADPKLNELGIVAMVEERKEVGKEFGGVEALNIALKWKRNAVVLCKVCDAEGTPLQQGNRSLSYMGPKAVNWWSSFPEPIPSNAQLQLYVQKNTRKVRVPFAFKDVEVPAVPKVGETGPGIAIPIEESK
jgi:hypothetical protein